MLAVTANWRLSDGTLAASRTSQAEDWLRAIRRAVVRAGFGRDGRYRPVQSICLVFAGDTFEWLLSDRWGGRDRPWHGGQRALAARTSVAAATLQAARIGRSPLRRWIRRGLPLPTADGRGRPSARELCQAPLRVVMLTGDRDAWIGESFGTVPVSVDRVGVLVGESWSDGRVNIRHGHDLDPSCHASIAASPGPSGRAPTLSESLTVELMVPFAMALRSETAVWALARPRMRAVSAANLRNLPREIGRLLAIWESEESVSRRLRLLWQRCVENWIGSARREPPACGAQHDLLDDVAAWLQAAGIDHELPPPAAIARLLFASHGLATGVTVFGHGPPSETSMVLSDCEPPWLAVILRDQQTGWMEPLGEVAAGPGVVTIGARASRTIVEAA